MDIIYFKIFYFYYFFIFLNSPEFAGRVSFLGASFIDETIACIGHFIHRALSLLKLTVGGRRILQHHV